MIKTVGAWVTNADIGKPAEAVETMKRARINCANLMLNDFSKSRGATDFWTRDTVRLSRFADACFDAGISVALTTWVMPHQVFVDGMLQQLPEILDVTRAAALYLDAEEPWTRAAGDFDRAVAAEQIGVLDSLVPLGLSAIVYTPAAKALPLAEVCSIYSPQAYAFDEDPDDPVDDEGLDPRTAVTRALQIWRAKFGEPERWSMGLAAYKLPDDPDDYMAPPIEQCREHGIDEVCYWTLGQAADDADRLDFIAWIRSADSPGPIFAWLDIEALPSSMAVHAVLIVQHLLAASGIDVGALDGKPGARTLAGVEAFQAARGMPVSGVVDYSTWCSLVSAS